MHRTRSKGWTGIVAALALAICAAAGSGAEDAAAGLHGARDRPDQGLRRRRSTRPIRTSSVKWVRDSTGVITAKLLAEKANPQADVVIGVSASSLAVFDNEGHARCRTRRRASTRYRRSTATRRIRRPGSAWTSAARRICFNTVEAQKHGPAEAGDVEGPDQARLQGPDRDAESGVVGHRLSSTSPAGSRCGARPTRWKYMDALHENIAQYTHSGSQAVPPGRRRRVSDRRLVRVPRGHHQEIRRADRHHLPERRPGLGPRGVGIMKGTKKLDAAKKLDGLDRSTPEAMALYAKNFAVARACRASQSRSSSSLPTTRSAWSRTTSPGRRRTATRSSPSGPSATTPSRKPK